MLMVQQGGHGIYVLGPYKVVLHRGDRIEVTGFTGDGDFAPVLVRTTLRLLGRGKLPTPAHPSIDDLLDGGDDNIWSELHGRLLAVQTSSRLWFDQPGEMCILQLGIGGVRVRALVEQAPPAYLDRMVGSMVRLRGGKRNHVQHATPVPGRNSVRAKL